VSSIEQQNATCVHVNDHATTHSHQIGTSLWQLQLEKKLSQEFQGKEK
jgi:hypothetical protein